MFNFKNTYTILNLMDDYILVIDGFISSLPSFREVQFRIPSVTSPFQSLTIYLTMSIFVHIYVYIYRFKGLLYSLL